MALKPLEILKKGITNLKKTIKDWKDRLQAQLAKGIPFHLQMRSGLTMKEMWLMNSKSLTHWMRPQTTNEGLRNWMMEVEK
jgi:hypothetical protein